MAVTVEALKAHINKVLSGIRFTNVEMDCRADLVLAYNYPIEEVAKMSEAKVYEILDNDGKEKEYFNEYGITCSKCGSLVDLEFTDNPFDTYYTVCKCGHSELISVYYIDEIIEGRERFNQLKDELKPFNTYCLTDIDIEYVKTHGEFIQSIEFDEKEDFYKLNGKYYCIGRRHNRIYEMCIK